MVIVHGIILLLIAFLELVLGLYILLRNPKNEISRWYSLLVFSIMLWVIGNGGSIFFNNLNIINFINKLAWVGPIILAPTFLFLSWVFPYKTKALTIKNWLIFFIPIIFFLIILFTSFLPIMKSTNLDEWRTPNFGPGLHLFNAFFIIYWLWAIYNFYKKYKTADGIHHWQLKYLLIGIIISSLYGITLNLILPWINMTVLPIVGAIGAEASIFWLGFTAYVLFKKDIKHI